jgi:hypothetical protein
MAFSLPFLQFGIAIPIGISLQVMSTIFSGALLSIEDCALFNITLYGFDRALRSPSLFWLPIEHYALVLGRLLRRIEHITLPFGVTSHWWLSLELTVVVNCRHHFIIMVCRFIGFGSSITLSSIMLVRD